MLFRVPSWSTALHFLPWPFSKTPSSFILAVTILLNFAWCSAFLACAGAQFGPLQWRLVALDIQQPFAFTSRCALEHWPQAFNPKLPSLSYEHAVYKQLGKLHCLRQDDQVCQLVLALTERGVRMLTPMPPARLVHSQETLITAHNIVLPHSISTLAVYYPHARGSMRCRTSQSPLAFTQTLRTMPCAGRYAIWCATSVSDSYRAFQRLALLKGPWLTPAPHNVLRCTPQAQLNVHCRVQVHGIRQYAYTRLPWYTEAGRHGHVGVLRLVSEQGEDPEAMVGALCLACRHGHTDAVQLLLSYGVPRNVEVKVDPYSDARAVSPLECASASGNAQIAMQLVAAAPPLNLRYVREHLESLFRRSPRSLTAAGIPAAQWLLTPRRGDLIRESAPDLLARADGPETEQQLLALCRGVRDHWRPVFRWAVLQGREDLVRQLAAPPPGADAAAAEELRLWLADWNEGMSVAGVPPAMLGVLQGMGLNTWDGTACLLRALEAGSMEDVRVQLAAACGGAGDGGAAAARAGAGRGTGAPGGQGAGLAAVDTAEQGAGVSEASLATAGLVPAVLSAGGCQALAAVLRIVVANQKHWPLLSDVVKGGVDLEAKLPLLLDALAEIEPAEADGQHGLGMARAEPGLVLSLEAVLRVALALDSAVKLQDGGAALGLMLRDERARAVALRETKLKRLQEAACRGGDVGTLRVLLRELGEAGPDGAAAGAQAQAQGGRLEGLQGLLPLAAGHRSGAALRQLLSAGVRLGADVAAGMEAARAACRAGSAECLRLLADACGAEQVVAWDGRELLLAVMGCSNDVSGAPKWRGAPAPALPDVFVVLDVLRNAYARVGAGAGSGEQRPASEPGAGSAGGAQRHVGSGGNSSDVDTGGGSCDGPAPESTAAAAGWHVPMPPQEVYQRAVQSRHWDVAAWALKHLPRPPPDTLPSKHTVTADGLRKGPDAAPGGAPGPWRQRHDAGGAPAQLPSPPSSPPQATVPALPLQQAVASGDLDRVRRLMDLPAVFSWMCCSELLALASYHGHVLVLRALLARLGAHLRLRLSDLWAGVEAAAVGGCAMAAGELLGMLRAVPSWWASAIGTKVAPLQETARRAGHREVAELLAAAMASEPWCRAHGGGALQLRTGAEVVKC